MTKDQLLNFAMNELSSVKLFGNTRQETKIARKEIKAIVEEVIKISQNKRQLTNEEIRAAYNQAYPHLAK